MAYFPVVNGQTISDPFELPLNATTADGCTITAIGLYVDNELYQSLPENAQSGGFHFPRVSLPSGYHTLVAVVWNQNGYSFRTKNFTVFESVPNIKIFVNSPADGTTSTGPMLDVDVRTRWGGTTLENPQTLVTHLRVYVDNQDVYDTNADRANFYESFSSGTHYMVVVAWDAQGYSISSTSTFTVK